MRFARGVVQQVLRPRVGIEGFALLDADRGELIDHRPVSLQPGFRLHDPAKRFEEPHVVRDSAVIDEVDRVDEDCRWRCGGL
jgi:hypothetical protein